jgi:1,4-dihydroxy-2-naphthoate octaprenyltransferase
MPGKNSPPSSFKIWFIASRPWSWPASIVPALFGTALASAYGGAPFRPGIFAAALIGVVILHSGANVMSDADDLDKGLDKLGQVTPVTGGVARGWITPAQARRGAAVFLAAGALIGLGIVMAGGGATVLGIGAAGILVGYLYARLKYNALGDLAVFLNFGPLATAGAWAAQTGSFSWYPLAWGVPSGLIIIGILHANNWRDMASDKAGGIRTVAGLLGDKGSMVYYCLLISAPFLYVAGAVLLSRGWVVPLPWSMLAVFLALPMAIDRVKKAARRADPASPMDFVILDGATARLNMIFGLLMTAGLVIGEWL